MLRSCARRLAQAATLEGRLLAPQGEQLQARQLFAGRAAFFAEDDTHSDFKPQQHKGGSTESVKDFIAREVKANRVLIFMKGSPKAPQCGFSNMACRVLDAYGVEYGSHDVLKDAELRQGIKDFTDWPTIPQVFVDGEFVGGADILMSMHQSGELEKLLKAKPK